MNISLLFILKESIEGLRRGLFHSFIAAAAAGLAMCVLGLFAYGALNLQRTAQGLLNQMQIEAFISLALPESRHSDLQRAVETLDQRWQVKYVSRTEAASLFAREFDSQLFDVLKANPLPASFKITLPLQSVQPDSFRSAAARLIALPGIEDAVYDSDLLNMIYAGKQRLSSWGYFGSIAIILIALGLIFNAARLKIDAQRDGIHLMSLLGATPWMLRGIYLTQGAILGGIGGLVSSILIVGLRFVVQMRLAGGIDLVLPHPYLPAVGGLLLGMIGGGLAVGRYLRV
ncbi:MAG: permease-like cell division protein FtsX [bacterium]|nr:permease-like cell division protein FtsX [bacterium]